MTRAEQRALAAVTAEEAAERRHSELIGLLRSIILLLQSSGYRSNYQPFQYSMPPTTDIQQQYITTPYAATNTASK